MTTKLRKTMTKAAKSAYEEGVKEAVSSIAKKKGESKVTKLPYTGGAAKATKSGTYTGGAKKQNLPLTSPNKGGSAGKNNKTSGSATSSGGKLMMKKMSKKKEN